MNFPDQHSMMLGGGTCHNCQEFSTVLYRYIDDSIYCWSCWRIMDEFDTFKPSEQLQAAIEETRKARECLESMKPPAPPADLEKPEPFVIRYSLEIFFLIALLIFVLKILI